MHMFSPAGPLPYALLSLMLMEGTVNASRNLLTSVLPYSWSVQPSPPQPLYAVDVSHNHLTGAIRFAAVGVIQVFRLYLSSSLHAVEPSHEQLTIVMLSATAPTECRLAVSCLQ